MRYFKVQKGYNADDFISIDETEYSTALRAQVTGKIAIFKEGSISGNNIISVTPDWNKVMGYNRDYKLTGEDYLYIGKERVEDYRLFSENEVLKLEGKEQSVSLPENLHNLNGLTGGINKL